MKIWRKRFFTRRPLLTVALIFFGFFPAGGAARAPSGSSPEDDENRKAVYEMYEGYRKNFPEVAEMAPSEAMERWRKDRVVFIDTRTPEEMAVSTLPGTISKEEYLKNPERFSGRTPVAYCTISYRSGMFAREMAEKSRRILNLRGGMLAWVWEGGPIFQEDVQTRRMHVYGKKWDLAPAGYETVRFSKWRQLMKSRQ
ncbi:MAG: rhodanese-like domain-containing protein [Desulfococcaceae bacterium]